MRRAIDSDLTWEQLFLTGFFRACLIISNITVAQVAAFELSFNYVS